MSLERWVKDLETVINVLGYERVTLLGVSQGAAISAVYAARHPERVDRLVLYGGYARGHLKRDMENPKQFVKLRREMVRAGWGSGDPMRKGDLIGSVRPKEKLDAAVRGLEQNWLIRITIIAAAILGVAIFVLELFCK